MAPASLRALAILSNYAGATTSDGIYLTSIWVSVESEQTVATMDGTTELVCACAKVRSPLSLMNIFSVNNYSMNDCLLEKNEALN